MESIVAFERARQDCAATTPPAAEDAFPCDLVSVLARTRTQANHFLVREMAAAGMGNLATSHGDILSELFEEDALLMSQLAHRVGRDPSTVTALVKRLVAAGYVTTARNTHDRRAVMVSLTPAGHNLRSRFAAISKRLLAVQSEGISSHDAQVARRVLLRMQENLGRANACGEHGDVPSQAAEPDASRSADAAASLAAIEPPNQSARSAATAHM
ncbi:MAG TPA: winged helix-turn-helix transcriptional regulator [Candidatus Limicola stercorigallinarum]|nr:winged helix-turn-helix transcriptional regulator [Candidatus Limicola stercorigallinarum]